MASQEAFLSIQPQSYVEVIHGVDEQLTRTPSGVHYSSKYTWTPNGVHLLLNWCDVAPDVTSRDNVYTYLIMVNIHILHTPHHFPLNKMFIEDGPWQWTQFPHGWFLGIMVSLNMQCDDTNPLAPLWLYSFANSMTSLVGNTNECNIKKYVLNYVMCFACVCVLQWWV